MNFLFKIRSDAKHGYGSFAIKPDVDLIPKVITSSEISAKARVKLDRGEFSH